MKTTTRELTTRRKAAFYKLFSLRDITKKAVRAMDKKQLMELSTVVMEKINYDVATDREMDLGMLAMQILNERYS